MKFWISCLVGLIPTFSDIDKHDKMQLITEASFLSKGVN